MIIKGLIAQELQEFIKESQLNKVEDQDIAIAQFANKIEEIIIKTIKSADVHIKNGNIIVQTPTGPATNITPLILLKPLQ